MALHRRFLAKKNQHTQRIQDVSRKGNLVGGLSNPIVFVHEDDDGPM